MSKNGINLDKNANFFSQKTLEKFKMYARLK